MSARRFSGYIDLSFPFFFSFSFLFLSFPPSTLRPSFAQHREKLSRHREGEDDNRVLFFWLCVTPQTRVTPTFDIRKTQLRVDAGEFFERKEERWPLTRPTDTSSSTMLDTGRKGKGGGDGRTPTSLLVRLFTALRLSPTHSSDIRFASYAFRGFFFLFLSSLRAKFHRCLFLFLTNSCYDTCGNRTVSLTASLSGILGKILDILIRLVFI